MSNLLSWNAKHITCCTWLSISMLHNLQIHHQYISTISIDIITNDYISEDKLICIHAKYYLFSCVITERVHLGKQRQGEKN